MRPFLAPRPAGADRTRGTTLFELMMVMSLLAAAAGLLVPRYVASIVSANETAAITTLRQIHTAQTEIIARGAIDTNADGGAEYGYLGELAGTAPLRTPDLSGIEGGSGNLLTPPVLPPFFGNVVESTLVRGGYVFRMYLPDREGHGVAEAYAGGASEAAPDPELSQRHWACYAFPETPGLTGSRAFFVNEVGEILQLRLPSSK